MSVMTRTALVGVSFALILSLSCGSGGLSPQERAARFLDMYDGNGQKIYAVTSEAYWQSATDVTDQHVGERIGAERALAAFSGSRYVIKTARELLELARVKYSLTIPLLFEPSNKTIPY